MARLDFFERRDIVHAVANHRHISALLFQRSDDFPFRVGFDAGEEIGFPDCRRQFRIGHRFQLVAGIGAGCLDSGLTGNCPDRFQVIPGNYLERDMLLGETPEASVEYRREPGRS